MKLARQTVLLGLLTALSLFGFQRVQAATRTWDGGGANANWDTVNNWDNNATPANGDDIVFATGFGSGTSISLNGVRTVRTLSITTTTDFSLNNNILTITDGTLTRSAASGTTTINSGVALGANGAWNIAGNLTVNGLVSGGKNLTKSGTGTLTLSAANNAGIGKMTVSGGTVRVQNSLALGDGDVDIGASGTVELEGSGLSIGNKLNTLDGTLRNVSGDNTWAGSGHKLNGAARIDSDSGTLTFSGGLDLEGKALTVGGAGNVTFSTTAIIDNGSLTKDGTGTLTLAVDNTYVGTTTVNGGVLRLNTATALPGGIGSSGGTRNLNINGGVVGLGNNDFQRGLGTGNAQVQFTGSGGFAAYTADRNVNLGGVSVGVTWNSGSFVPTGSSLILGASGADKTVTFQNPISLNGAVRSVQADNGSAAIDGVLSGKLTGGASSGLTKTGNGTLAITGNNNNDYQGVTTVSVGALNIQDANALGATGGANNTVVNSGAALEIQGVITTAAEGLNLNGTGVANDGALRNVSGNNTYAGAITLDSSSRINSGSGTLTLSGGVITASGKNVTAGGSGDVTFQAVAISGGGSVTKDGSGTLNLNVANTYSGGTTLSAGTLKLGVTDALGTGGFAFAGGILDANNTTDSTIGALTLSTSSTLAFHSTTPGTLTFDSATRSGGTLSITGWTGTAGSAGTDDRIFVSGSASQDFLNNVNFDGFDPGAVQLGTGEIVPVPEPINVALGIFGVVFAGVAVGRQLRARARAQAEV